MSELNTTSSIRDLGAIQGKVSSNPKAQTSFAGRNSTSSSRSSFAAVLSDSDADVPSQKGAAHRHRTTRQAAADEKQTREEVEIADDGEQQEAPWTTATSERPTTAGGLRDLDDDTGGDSRPQLGRGKGKNPRSAFEAVGISQQEDATTALLQRKAAVVDGEASTEVARKMTVLSATEQVVDQGAIAAKATSESIEPAVAAPDVSATETPASEAKAPPPTTEAVRVAATPTTAAPAAPIPPRAMAAVQAALAQDGTRVKIFENGARLSLQLNDGSEVSVRLLMRDGAVDIRAAGHAAGFLESRAPELRAALSSEGLKLGTFSSGAGSSGTDSNGQDSDANALLFDDEDRTLFGSGNGKTASTLDASTPARRMHNGKSVVV